MEISRENYSLLQVWIWSRSNKYASLWIIFSTLITDFPISQTLASSSASTSYSLGKTINYSEYNLRFFIPSDHWVGSMVHSDKRIENGKFLVWTQSLLFFHSSSWSFFNPFTNIHFGVSWEWKIETISNQTEKRKI